MAKVPETDKGLDHHMDEFYHVVSSVCASIYNTCDMLQHYKKYAIIS